MSERLQIIGACSDARQGDKVISKRGEIMSYEDEEYDPDMYQEFGEGFETDFDAVSETSYEEAFTKESQARQGNFEFEEPLNEESDQDINEDDYEFDSVVGGRDKKPVMSILNKGKLSKYEMDDLLNSLDN